MNNKPVTIDLKLLSLRQRNVAVTIAQRSKEFFSLENQELKVSLNVAKEILEKIIE